MTIFARIPTVLLNPLFLALLTSGWGLGTTSNEVPAPRTQPQSVTKAEPAVITTPPAPIPEWLQATPVEPPTKAQRELAHRFTLALNGKATTTSSPTTLRAKSEPSRSRVWVCGQWEELVQGRGQARTCEWREEPSQ